MSNNKSNVVHINEHDTNNRSFSLTEKSRHLDTCKSIASKYLKKQLQFMFDNVDDFLFDLADKAESNAQQTLYFDAMREIRLQKQFIENDFHREFNTHYKKSLQSFDNEIDQDLSKKNAFSESILDGLLLVEDDELEESLAISNMISKSYSLFRELLFALDQRYSYLLNVTGIEKENNPLGPTNLCSAFKCAVKRIDADIKIKIIVYKLFDRYVVRHFDELYQEVNKSLAQTGILPNIKVKIQQSKSTNQRQQSTRNSNNEEAHSLEEKSNTNGQYQNQPGNHFFTPQANLAGNIDQNNISTGGLFSTLQGLLSNQRVNPAISVASNLSSADGVPQSVDNYPSVFLQSQDVLNALSSIQNTAVSIEHIGETTNASIRNEIIKISGTSEKKQINAPDTDAIDIVSMLFDFILDDNNLPDCMKAVIGKLQIPILKVAILDKSFFGKKSHPARQLLNELANTEINWDSENHYEDDPLFEKICSIVDTIVNTFEDDVLIFSELLKEYYDFKEEEQLNNETVKEELLTAKISVAKEIGERIIYKIPNSIRCFITEVWKDVLTHIYLRDKKESIGWLTAIQVMDDLIWSIQPKSTKEDQDKLVKIIPNVLQGLQDGLMLINYDPNEKETLFQGLQRFHIASLKGGPTNTAKNQNDAESDNASYAIEGMEVDNTQISDDSFYHMALHRDSPHSDAPLLENAIDLEINLDSKFIDMAKELELGKWVEFYNQNGEKTKGKLVWKSEVMSEYTFVDRKYSIVADKSTRELAIDFSNGTAEVLVNIPLFDRALDAVIRGLKKVT